MTMFKHSFYEPASDLLDAVHQLEDRICDLGNATESDDYRICLAALLDDCRTAARPEDVHWIHVNYEIMVREVLGCSLH